MSRIKKDENVELQTTIKTLVNKICTSDEFITLISESIINTISKKYENVIEQLGKENKSLKEKLEEQEKSANILSNKFENLDQKYRNRGLRIYGVKETKNENIRKTVLEMANSKLKLSIKDTKIESCYRLGKQQKNNKPRPIFVYFTRIDVKQKIYNSKKSLKNTGIVIREDLTAGKLQVLKRAIGKIGGSGQVWTNNGRIFVKLGEEETVIRIDSNEDVEKL